MPSDSVPDHESLLQPLTRDCLDCGKQHGMKLQNPPAHFTTLYICEGCGTMLTIPPPVVSS